MLGFVPFFSPWFVCNRTSHSMTVVYLKLEEGSGACVEKHTRAVPHIHTCSCWTPGISIHLNASCLAGAGPPRFLRIFALSPYHFFIFFIFFAPVRWAVNAMWLMTLKCHVSADWLMAVWVFAQSSAGASKAADKEKYKSISWFKQPSKESLSVSLIPSFKNLMERWGQMLAVCLCVSDFQHRRKISIAISITHM